MELWCKIALMKKSFLTPFIFTALSLQLACSTLAMDNSWDADKIQALENSLYKNENQGTIEKYVELQKKQAGKFNFKKDNLDALDNLRSALYFLNDNKNSKEYIQTKEQFDKLILKSGFENDNYNRLEIAKNLYLECKYYASGYEFEELYEKGYECAICLEYLGDISLKTNSNKKIALEFYKKALEIEPNSASINFKIASTLNKMNKCDFAIQYYGRAINLTSDEIVLKEALLAFENALKRQPMNSNLYELLGTVYEKFDNYAKTYENYQKAIRLNPKDIFLKYKLGGLFYDTKRYAQALRLYSDILTDNLYESQIRAGKAKSLLALNRQGEALKEYQVILAIYPDSKQAKLGIYDIFKNDKNLDFIINNFYPLNTSFIPESKFYSDFGTILANAKENKNAIELYKKALAKDKKNSQAYLKLYELYELEGKDELAQNLIIEGYKNLPKDETIKKIYSSLNKISKKDQIALHYLTNNEWEKAIKIYEQIEPKTPEIYITIANCHKNLKNYKLSVENYKKSLELNNKNSDTYYLLALAYLDQKSPVLAQTTLEEAVNLNSKNVKAIKLLNYLKAQNITKELNEVYTYYENKDYRTALIKITDLATKYPGEAQAYYYRAIIFEATGDLERAIKDYQTTIRLKRSFTLAYYSLAKAYEKYGDEKSALTAYERYLSLEPPEDALVQEAQKKVIELGEKYY